MEKKKRIHAQNHSLKDKNQVIEPLCLNLLPNSQDYQTQINHKLTSPNPKNINLTLKHNSFSLNKMKKKSNSIQTNRFRPISVKKNQDPIKQHINMKNINLIKQNIKNLQNKESSQYVLKRKNQKKLKLYHNLPSNKNSSYQKQQQFLSKSKKRTQSQQEIFFFQKHNSEKSKKFPHRFERSKYFNIFPQRNQYAPKIILSSRSKNQNKLNLSKQNLNNLKNKKNHFIFDQIIPVIKHRNKKPKTAGGFLKKYQTERLFFMQNFFNSEQQHQIIF